MSKKALSTYEREMQNPEFKKALENEYKKLIISELIIALMTHNHKSVRSLAKECGLSPTAINKLRTGKQDDIMLSNFINITQACGYHIILEKDDQRFSISLELGGKSLTSRRAPVVARRLTAPRKSKSKDNTRKAG